MTTEDLPGVLRYCHTRRNDNNPYRQTVGQTKPTTFMRYLYSLLSCAAALMTLSCNSKNEEPVIAPRYHISWIYTDESYQVFEYDTSGRISEWVYKETTPGATDSYRSLYSYSDEDNTIAVVSEEKSGTDTWNFDERMYLDQYGTASHAAGTAILRKDDIILMRKSYAVEFRYNTSHRLTGAEITEKTIDSNGLEKNGSMTWTAELTWDDCNLVRYAEYTDPEHPMITKDYAYFGGNTVHYMPIVQGPVVRRYYMPLQYQGILGHLSAGMVKEMTISSQSLHMTTAFSYDIAASIHDSKVEGFSEIRGDKELRYTVGWDK